MLHRSRSVDGDSVPCEFKNLRINSNASYMICKNINTKLRSQREIKGDPIEQSNIEQLSSYERKMAYFIRFHLRDILTSDHLHVWFNIQTKSLEEIQDRSQILRNVPEDIDVVYCFGSMLSYDTFIEHSNDRSLARISLQKRSKAIQLKTGSCVILIELRNIDSQLLINHSTKDNSIQVIFMLKSPPIIEQLQGQIHRDRKAMIEGIPHCSDLLIRFFPASHAWIFLRELPIAGYTRRPSGNLFHINFAIFAWQKDPSYLLPMGKPTYNSYYESYAMEMLWSLGYIYQDKYNADSQVMNNMRNKNFYDLGCKIWHNLKTNHCYRLRDALNDRKSQNNTKNSSGSSELKEVAFVILTPSRIEYQPMPTTISHRGFNFYDSEQWLLVHIRDHNGMDKIRELDLQNKVRFKNFMIQGIRRNDRLYRYFGSSNSQMKDQAGWFLSLPQGETIEKAREKLGELSKIPNVSTYTARLGLYLSTSRSAEIKLVKKGEAQDKDGGSYINQSSGFFSSLITFIQKKVFKSENKPIEYMAIIIPDEKHNDFNFTDGCGKISWALAKKVALNIGIKISENSDVPSAFQVRIAGCKGMLSIDPKSKGKSKGKLYYILVRKSMVKFDSDDWTLHIVDHSRPMPLSLNNQVIRLLSDLGISNGMFESIQQRCIDQKEFWHPPPKSYLNAMDSLDQQAIEDKRKQYKNAKHFLERNKIPLPLNDGRFLFGIADETGILKPGQCFIQYRDLKDSPRSKIYHVHEGTVIVTKNPCLHPGDVRKLEAVWVEALESCIRDCIVFSTQGLRPSFNEMAGSDLDGDQYWVYWGDELKVTRPVEPLLYPSAEKKPSGPITNDLIVDHVLNSFTNSVVGTIGNLHKVIADKDPRGTLSPECKECASLFARAIDACKTGEEIPKNRINQLKEKYYQTCPTWMMKFDKPVMDPPSTSINEILFRKAQESWLDEDCYHDIVRPFQGVEFPEELIAIDIDDTNETEGTQDESQIQRMAIILSCKSCCLCIFVTAIVIVLLYGIFNWWKK